METQDSMCTLPGIRMTCTNLITEFIWNEWLGNELDFDSSSAAKWWPFFADTFPRDIGARWFQGRSREQLFWKLEWYRKLCSGESRLGQLSFIFFTEKIVWGFTGVTDSSRQHEKNTWFSVNLHCRATLQKMDVSSLLPDRSSMFQFDVHCRPIINKTVLLLDDWRDPFPPVFIQFLHCSLYSSHSHISGKLNKKILLAGSFQGPLILQAQGAKGTNIVCWVQGRTFTVKHPNFCSLKFLFSAVRSVKYKLWLTLGCFKSSFRHHETNVW